MKNRIVSVVAVVTLVLLCRQSASAFYNSSTGRWLSRDPVEADSNSYLFTRNNSLSAYDFLGLWKEDIHRDRTTQWATEVGIYWVQAHNIGIMDNAIDTIHNPGDRTHPITDANWSWHFDSSSSGNESDDSRLKHRSEEVARAKQMCTNPTDAAFTAAAFLGFALHPLQDWVAHGDFNRRLETPTLTGVGFPEIRHYWHNWDAGANGASSLVAANKPDDATLDADGTEIDGRAVFLGGELHFGTELSNRDRTYWTTFHTGSRRITKTEQLTKDLLSDFQNYVRANSKPCGQCQRAFLRGK